MKTKIRIIRSSNGLYNFLQIQMLHETFVGITIGSFNVFGSITFQQTKGEDEWYAMAYVVDTHRAEDLYKMNKVAKHVEKHCQYRSQPDEIIKILNATEYYLFNQEFFKVSDKGKFCYRIMRFGEGWCRFVAKDLVDAQKIFLKYKKTRTSDADHFSLGESFLIQ